MKLIDNFFYLHNYDSDGESLRCVTTLNESHPVYKAHFPGSPVTPGVCIVQMATEILENVRGVSLQLESASRIRFKQVVKPSDEVCFCYSKLTEEGDSLSVKVKVMSNNAESALLSLVCRKTK